MRLFIHPCTNAVMHLLLFTSLKVCTLFRFRHRTSNVTTMTATKKERHRRKKNIINFEYIHVFPVGISQCYANETLSAIWFCFAYISYVLRAMHTRIGCTPKNRTEDGVCVRCVHVQGNGEICEKELVFEHSSIVARGALWNNKIAVKSEFGGHQWIIADYNIKNVCERTNAKNATRTTVRSFTAL